MAYEEYDYYNEPSTGSLKDSLYKILRGLQNPQNLRETSEGISRVRQALPGVTESVGRGAIAAVPGSIGDISDFARTYAPEIMEKKFGKERFFPTTREILDYVPRMTPTHEGATTLEDVGAAISPGVGGVTRDIAIPAAKAYGRYVGPTAYKHLEDYLIKTGGIQQMMAGEKSKTFNPELKKAALNLEKENATPEQIWEATGMVRGPDKKWRTEISDQYSKLKENSLLQDKEWATDKNFTDFGALYKSDHMAPWGKVHLKDLFSHPELEKAYPDLFDKKGLSGVKVKLAPEDARYMGRVEDEGRTIAIRPDIKIEDARRIFNHELQHIVQKREGHATGGSQDTYPQQADAKIAAQALAIRREAERMDENIPWFQRYRASYDLHKGLGMNISPEAYAVAQNPISNPSKDLENLTILYGTDKNVEPYSPMKMYEKIAGEAEARLTENRMNLSDAERLANYPYKHTKRTYDENRQPKAILGLDVPLEQQIVHGHKPNTIDIGGKRILGTPDEVNPESVDYRGVHTAPYRTEDGVTAPAHELNRTYPDDVYGPMGYRYYGHGGDATKMDKETLAILQAAKGNPDYQMTVYRAVPKEFAGEDIYTGDWVTPNINYAKEHGRRFDDGYHIIEKTVPAKHIWTNADSIHEFGYDPTE
jgi:hypothetical protein